MKKLILCTTILCLGLLYSCDKNELVPEGDRPEWLGLSIYEELSTHKNLDGTFNYYMRLADDLGYTDVLSRTGSKTIFPANDEAFERFFAPGGNEWGVTSYEQLTEVQKKSLFYNSMLDNAILVGMMSNVSSSASSVMPGTAIKHQTNFSVIDSVRTMFMSDMPQNNKWWDEHRAEGLSVVRDNTRSMMVHFTREYMLNHNITTNDNKGINDFKILTGADYTESTDENPVAYVFRDKVIKGNVTCQNGYIHQVQDVLMQPGNMAEMLEKDPGTTVASRIINYFSAPYLDMTTTNQYNEWALANNKPTIDKIYQIRYISNRSQLDNVTGKYSLLNDPNRAIISSSQALKFDPGWNAYYPNVAQAGTVDYSIADIGAMFVPTDEAMWNYFRPGSGGSTFMEVYGKRENTRENLFENLDSLHVANPQILTSFVNNLMFPEFSSSVPSKFYALTNDATDNLGMTLDKIQQKADGKYDVLIANNGVIYKINEVIPPAEYSCVLQPASLFKDMRVINWAIQDRTYLGLDFKFFLLATSANYRLFLPDDGAFNNSKNDYYVDPTSLMTETPLAVRFYYDEEQSGAANKLNFEFHEFDPSDNSVSPQIFAGPFSFGSEGQAGYKNKAKSLLIDILNTHTILLDQNAGFGKNKYYLTKSGAGIYVDLDEGVVKSGSQIDDGLPASKITSTYGKFVNGYSYRLDGLVQPTWNSVYSVLNPEGKVAKDGRFSKFFTYCNIFSSDALLEWAGISPEIDQATGTSPQARYKIFVENNGLDQNVRLFNTYNYTLYAPNNDAIDIAIENGLPSIDDINDLYEKYTNLEEWDPEEPEVIDAKARVLAALEAIRKFVRYHFQTTTVFVDEELNLTNPAGDTYQSLLSDEMGVAKKYTISGGGGVLKIKDLSGKTVTIDASAGGMVNKLTRDYEFDANKRNANSIVTSSYAAVHEISTPLCYSTDGKFNDEYVKEADEGTAKQRYAALLRKIKNLKD